MGLMFASLAFPYNLQCGPLIFSYKNNNWFVKVGPNTQDTPLTIAIGGNEIPLTVGPNTIMIPFQVTDNTGGFTGAQLQVTPNATPVADGGEQPGTNLHSNELGGHMAANEAPPAELGDIPGFTIINTLTPGVLNDLNTIAGGTQVATPQPAAGNLTLDGTQVSLGGGAAISVAALDDQLQITHHNDNQDEADNNLPTVTVNGLTATQYSRTLTQVQVQNDGGTNFQFYMKRIMTCEIWRDALETAQGWGSYWRRSTDKTKKSSPLHVDMLSTIAVTVMLGLGAKQSATGTSW